MMRCLVSACLLFSLAGDLFALEAPRKKAPTQTPQPLVTKAPKFDLPDDPRPFVDAPEAGGMEIQGLDEAVAPFTYLTVNFPRDMVAADAIDVLAEESPVVIWPDTPTEFTWRTPTSGSLVILGPVIPGQTYRLRLREGVTALDGEPLPVDEWGAQMESLPMRVSYGGYWGSSRLGARPSVTLEFNYPVDLADAAARTYFQDRLSRERFPAEILLNRPEADHVEPDTIDVDGQVPDKIYYVRFRPAQPLPVGRTFDFVADGVRDAYAGRPIAYPFVSPMGTTTPLGIDFVTAKNEALEKPSITVKFDQSLDETQSLPREALQISPPVADLRLRISGNLLIAEGDFKIPSRYTVTVSDAIRGAGGFGLAKSETWGATFRNRRGGVFFPDREVRQRSALGLRFAFIQVNTGELEWKLARVPDALLPAIRARLNEYAEGVEDASGAIVRSQDGYFLQTPTEPLVSAFTLPVAASGKVEASGDDIETLRTIEWQPDSADAPSGPMLLEVTGRDSLGRLVGNRAIILFGDVALTRKTSQQGTAIRVADLGTAQPVPGAKVTLLDRSEFVLDVALTDADGVAPFEAAAAGGATAIQAEFQGRTTLQPLALSSRFPGGYEGWRAPPPLLAYTFTDRPLYRPAQTVHFKGFIRESQNGELRIPRGQSVEWTIHQPYSREVVASGTATLAPEGGWHAEWTPPEEIHLGYYFISSSLGGTKLGEPARFQIEEFRNPPFSVVCEPVQERTPGVSTIQISSQYFHGAANAGARVVWKASWCGDSEDGYQTEDDPQGMNRVDLHSEQAPKPSFFAEAEAEAVLDAQGRATIKCVSPFPDPANRARATVFWRVDVTGPDGQTITGGTYERVDMLPAMLGVRAGDSRDGSVAFAWDSLATSGEPPASAEATLYHVVTKSVRERLAPNVYRYRNFDHFSEVARQSLNTVGDFEFAAATPGRYVVVLNPPDGTGAIPVSAATFLPGPGEAEVEIHADTTAAVLPISPANRDPAAPWLVGDTAAFHVVAPTAGVAWITVETDRILHSFTTPLEGNTARIEIPVKPEYEPNAFVSVYLLRPGGDDGLAGEMFGYTEMAVRAPGRQLDIAVQTDQSRVEPRERITGRVRVTTDGRPAGNADLAIYAVDDSILTLGGWSLPTDILPQFFPRRQYGVVTYSALDGYVKSLPESWLTSKGFIVGGGGADEFGNVTFVRKDFKPLILWLPSVRTAADGTASFAAEAPDNLGRFRFIAVGQTPDNQFGAGDTTVEVAKSLMVEPALPRFLREGDEVELRAVIRQTAADRATVRVRCEVEGMLELTDPQSPISVEAERDAPVVVTFRGRAQSVGTAHVEFTAALEGGTLADAIRISLPVEEPVLLIRESVAGKVNTPSFSASEVTPPSWLNARGTSSLFLSTTPWLPKLMGIPFLLEYPHGCLEQRSSKLLVYTNLARLLAYLPDTDNRADSYAQVISSTLQEFEKAVLPGGFMPYWPGGTTPDLYVTSQIAWCVLTASQAGIEAPPRLAEGTLEAMMRVLNGGAAGSTPTFRTFALFMLSSTASDLDEELRAAATEIYATRDRLTSEGQALLALAMLRLDMMPDERLALVKALPNDFQSVSFNPSTFASPARSEALATWAKLEIDPDADRSTLIANLESLMESSQSLSTQENLWLLVAFNALLDASPQTPLRANQLRPRATTIAPNSTAAAWSDIDLDALASFSASGLSRIQDGSFVLTASYRPEHIQSPLVSQGIRIERVVKNLTDPKREGTPQAPFKLGDQLLISYRFASEKDQSFVALEDLLPAGVEVINPDLALFSQMLGQQNLDAPNPALLSYSQLRDTSTNLYFDRFPAGNASYAVLARATAVGTFTWPATQIYPMYDSRFFGRSPSSVCIINQ